jgi:hypothetical protein
VLAIGTSARASVEQAAKDGRAVPSISAGEQALLGRALITKPVVESASSAEPSVSAAVAARTAAGVFGRHDPILGAELRHVTSAGVLSGDYWIVALQMTGPLTGHLPPVSGAPAAVRPSVTVEPYRFVFVSAETGAYTFAMDGSLSPSASRRLAVIGGPKVVRGTLVNLRGTGFDQARACRTVRVQIDQRNVANTEVGRRGALSVSFVVDRHLSLGDHQLSVWQPASSTCRLPVTATELTITP